MWHSVTEFSLFLLKISANHKIWGQNLANSVDVASLRAAMTILVGFDDNGVK
jgi:hypothetical protein